MAANLRQLRVREFLGKLKSESGSAVAEFSLISILVAVLALSVLQLGLYLHVRNSVTDIAVQSAHYASLRSNTVENAEVRARELLNSRFPHLSANSVDASIDAHGVISVEITTTLPLIWFAGPSNSLQVSGHALDEDVW